MGNQILYTWIPGGYGSGEALTLWAKNVSQGIESFFANLLEDLY